MTNLKYIIRRKQRAQRIYIVRAQHCHQEKLVGVFSSLQKANEICQRYGKNGAYVTPVKIDVEINETYA